MTEPKREKSEPKLFDGAFYFLCVLAIVGGAASLWIHGPAIVPQVGATLLADTILVVPQLVVGVLVGALFSTLVPKDVVARSLGHQAGLGGILLATFIGTVTPGGPFASFPIVYALARSGAGMGPLIAFLVAWASTGLNRLLIWELPFMGFEFAFVRFVSSLPLPIIAGLIADRLSSQVGFFKIRWD